MLPNHFAAYMRIVSIALLGSALLPLTSSIFAADSAAPATHGDGATQAQGVPDAGSAMKTFKFDQGLTVSLFASEPLLANGVAFAPDDQGRWYVAETYRQEKGIEDNRGHANWLDDDIASKSVEDRLAMMRKFYPDAAKFSEKFEQAEERITRLEDTNGDGVADKTTVYADGFRDPLDGTGAGVIARGNEVWWTCIPNLWHFQDSNGDGKADVRDKQLTGFGVKFAFRGHDMHGLRFGPDGKLYFSIGDRGINVTSKEGRKFEEVDTGCIMRCNPDGTGFEVFATGVRNPQELAFNEYGDLFTGDNNSDGGDKARFVQLVEGGDCGWRMTYQYLNDRGPWNREKLWDEKEGQNAKYIIPPIANIGAGPSGLTYAPGTGLSPKFNGHFFLSDFRGAAGQSVVHDILLERKGAWYRLKERDDFIKGILTSDVEFGTDGGLYVLDWVESWSGSGKGRIYKFTAKEADVNLQRETQKLLAEGMANRPDEELLNLFGHPDQRVRQAAQFSLAAKGAGVAPGLAKTAQSGPNQLARLHAIWGLGQIAEKKGDVAGLLLGLLSDGDAEVKAQAAKVLGDRRVGAAGEKLVPLLGDASPRVRFQAAMALGKIGHKPAFDALFTMAAENADKDPILRHGAVMGLVGVAKPEQLAAKRSDGNPAVKNVAVVALRRLKSPLIAEFLRDPDEGVVLEAARAIHDKPVPEALPALAELVNTITSKNPRVLERAINANYRLGQAAHARALARFAGNPDVPESSRREALDALGEWANPNPKDRILNMWRPLPGRGATDATVALAPVLASLLKDQPSGVCEAAARAAQLLKLKDSAQALTELVMNQKAGTGARMAALFALKSWKDQRLPQAAHAALGSKDDKLRSEGLKALAEADPPSAVKSIADVLERGSVREKQGALVALAAINLPEAKNVVSALMDRLIAGQCQQEIQLDVYEAAKKCGLQEKVQQFKASLPKEDPLSNFQLSLAGGDVEKGRRIFREKADVQCLRCHKCEIGDSQVGPDLTKIGTARDRRYLLESIVQPNAKVAEGFQIVTLTTKDNQMVAGRLMKDEGGKLTIETVDEHGKAKPVEVPGDQVKERLSAPSPMPENIRDQLSRWELRDLVEYLATRK
jgi:quinoprotein glucose dehydrogenase